MNPNLNPLEKQLESWTPRPASSEVRDKLFQKAPGERQLHIFGKLLLPAMACAMALLAAGNSESGGTLSGTTNSIAMFASNQNFRLSELDGRLDWSLVKATFEWTNQHVSPSSNGSLPLAKINLLMQMQ